MLAVPNSHTCTHVFKDHYMPGMSFTTSLEINMCLWKYQCVEPTTEMRTVRGEHRNPPLRTFHDPVFSANLTPCVHC